MIEAITDDDHQPLSIMPFIPTYSDAGASSLPSLGSQVNTPHRLGHGFQSTQVSKQNQPLPLRDTNQISPRASMFTQPNPLCRRFFAPCRATQSPTSVLPTLIMLLTLVHGAARAPFGGGGYNCTTVNSNLPRLPSTIATAANGENLVIGGVGDYLFTSIDGGSTTTNVNQPPAPANDTRGWTVCSSSTGQFLLAGGAQTLEGYRPPGYAIYSTNYGATWNPAIEIATFAKIRGYFKGCAISEGMCIY